MASLTVVSLAGHFGLEWDMSTTDGVSCVLSVNSFLLSSLPPTP